MLKLRIFIGIALFQLVLGAGILAGGLFANWDAKLYFGLFANANKHSYTSLEYKGINDDNGLITIQPYQKAPLPSIPLISVDRKSSTESFTNYPAQPMDWAVLLYRLRDMGVRHIGVMSPFVWEEEPNDIVTEALGHELNSFKSRRIGKTLSLTARESLPPEEWKKLALDQNQYAGDAKKLPSANKFYGSSPQLSKNIHLVPDIIENEDLFSSTSAKEHKSAPLFIRWNNSIYPTLPLLVALDAMGLTLQDIYAHFGGTLRLGHKINIPIDEAGRIPLAADASADVLDLSAILSEAKAIDTSEEEMNRRKIAHAILTSSPAVIVSEAATGAEQPSDTSLLAARTIKNLFSRIQAAPPVYLHPVSAWIQWILIIDIIVIGFWAFQFDGWIRRSLLGFAIGIIPIVACYKWIASSEWLPLSPYLASIIALFLLKRFIPRYRKDDGEEAEDEETRESPPSTSSPLPKVPAPEHEFNEPEEVPIPKTKK